jgi:ABC-type multidrug transport system fused ATPase/permease subunit
MYLHDSQIVINHYSLEYFDSLILQKISFFDDEDNSVGTLTSRLSGDVKQLEELLGMNLAMVMQS